MEATNFIALTGTRARGAWSKIANMMRPIVAIRAPPIDSNQSPPATPKPTTTIAISTLSSRELLKAATRATRFQAGDHPPQLVPEALVLVVLGLENASVILDDGPRPHLAESQKDYSGEEFECVHRDQGLPAHEQRYYHHKSDGATGARKGVAPAGDASDHQHYREYLDQLDKGPRKSAEKYSPVQARTPILSPLLIRYPLLVSKNAGPRPVCGAGRPPIPINCLSSPIVHRISDAVVDNDFR